MDDRKLGFLTAVLGLDAAKALAKAAERSKPLGHALVPRAIMSWVSSVGDTFEGEIPGVTNSYLCFQKTELGFAGSITIGDDVYSFGSASNFHVGACVSVAVGSHEDQVDTGIRDLDLDRLGKSIDFLVKGRLEAQALAKQAPQQPKAQRHGVAAQPLKPAQPDAAEPGHKQPRAPSIKRPDSSGYVPPAPKLRPPAVKVPGLPPLKIAPIKIAKSLTRRECGECGLTQFDGARFKGCMCFRAMSKSVTVRESGDTLELGFGTEWDEEALSVLLETLGVHRGR